MTSILGYSAYVKTFLIFFKKTINFFLFQITIFFIWQIELLNLYLSLCYRMYKKRGQLPSKNYIQSIIGLLLKRSLC